MSLTADQITAQNFKDFYDRIRPYLNNGSSSSGGHVIEDSDDTELTQRDTLQFAGDLETDDDSTNEKTVVTPHELSNAEIQEIMSDFPGLPVNILRLGNKFDRANMYSTDERIIGQWIDGKPVYQRTITDSLSNTPSASTWGTIYTASWVSEIDTLIVGFIHTDGYTYSGCLFRTSTNNLQIHSRISSDPLVSVTIQYTKTTDLATSIGEDTEYSTTEKIVGSWIDGKPLYQKTVSCGALSNKSSIVIQHNISNLGQVVSFSGVATSSSNNNITLPYTHDTTASENIALYVTSTEVQIENRGANKSGFTSSYVTIQYTKTTD